MAATWPAWAGMLQSKRKPCWRFWPPRPPKKLP